jgi:hypothetical protein
MDGMTQVIEERAEFDGAMEAAHAKRATVGKGVEKMSKRKKKREDRKGMEYDEILHVKLIENLHYSLLLIEAWIFKQALALTERKLIPQDQKNQFVDVVGRLWCLWAALVTQGVT